MNKKRFIVCVIGGAVAAFICIMGMKSSGRTEVTTTILLSGIGNRVLIGIVIGISGWKINYLLHGVLIGLIVTLSTSIVMIPDSLPGFCLYTVAGMIYGFLIELFATKVFKAGMA
jgi:hypothetical protein